MEFEPDRGVHHICTKSGVCHFAVTMEDPSQRMADLFSALADAGVSVYLLKLHPDANVVDFAVDTKDCDRAEQVLKRLNVQYRLLRDFHLVSLVAAAMRDLSGVVVRIMTALNNRGIEIHELADSYNSVSCLVSPSDLDRAVEALSEEFGVALRECPGPLDPW